MKNIIDGLDYIQKQAHSVEESPIKSLLAIGMMCRSLKAPAEKLQKDYPMMSLVQGIDNIEFSAGNLARLYAARSPFFSARIYYELIPLIQEVIYDTYFFTQVFGDPEAEKKHYENDYLRMTENRPPYKYDVSIIVLAYNKVAYTQKCIESILTYTPDINYELIILNNGSTDETYDYFNSLGVAKTIHLRTNSLQNIKLYRRITEGGYICTVSNDVICTHNYLQNLITCMESDERIGIVVPSTPNVSNYQEIPHTYSTEEEMHAFAMANNISDPTRWEERQRILNPIALLRADALRVCGEHDNYFPYAEFSDDALSYRLRSKGYKLMLAKDAYCHHYGSVTLGDAQRKENTLGKSRELFKQRHGFDAWDEDLLRSSMPPIAKSGVRNR